MPASVIPMASTTAMHPSGMASIAARVERGDDQDSGVARSSRTGLNRRVNAGPTSRGEPGRSGRQPRIQTLRSPFFSKMVVIVAVDTPDSVWTTLRLRVIPSPSDAGDQTSIDANDRASDVRGTRAGQKSNSIRILFGVAVAADGDGTCALSGYRFY